MTSGPNNRAPEPLPDRLRSAPDPAAIELIAHIPRPSPNRAWRLVDRLVVVGFCLVLVVPAAVFAGGARPAAIENRPLLTPPPVSVDGLLDPDWYTAVDRYLADNVAARALAVSLRAEVDTNLGGTANPDVVLGQGDWLFTREEIQPSCRFTPAELAAQIDRTQAAFARAGQEFRFIVIPDKHAIYADKLRPDMAFGEPCTDRVRGAMRAVLDERASFAVDGWSIELAARAAHPDGPLVYYPQDSHWTPSGVVPAIAALMKTFGAEYWRDEDVVSAGTALDAQELAGQMGLTRGEPTLQLTVRPTVRTERTTIDVSATLHNAEAIFRFRSAGDRPLLAGRTAVIYDSFFLRNMARVAPFFEDSVWIHVNDLKDHPELGAELGPFDRVVMERVERGLYATPIEALLRPLVRTGG